MRRPHLFLLILLAIFMGRSMAGERDKVADILKNKAALTPLKLSEAVIDSLFNMETDDSTRIDIVRSMLLPYCLTVKDGEQRNMALANSYRCLSLAYGQMADYPAEHRTIDTAIMYGDKTKNLYLQGIIYSAAADAQIRSGSVGRGHELGYKAVELFEKDGGNDEKIASVYYQLAVMFDENVKPRNADSVEYYLNKAAQSHQGLPTDTEIDICVFSMQAENLYVQKKYAQAERKNLEVLAILGTINPNNVLTEFEQTYDQLSRVYEAMGKYDLALKYSRLRMEKYKELFDAQKASAIHDVAEKYENTEKQLKIEILEQKQHAATKIMFIGIVVIGLLAISIYLIITVFRMKRRTLEQNAYEAILLSDIKQSEVENAEKSIHELKKEYDNLQNIVTQSIKTSEKYKSQLVSLKERIEQKPSTIAFKKMVNTIKNSNISTENKQKYIKKLENINTDELEKIFASTVKITSLDIKYLLCFAIYMSTPDIATMFNIELSSVHTVKYRIKKKTGLFI